MNDRGPLFAERRRHHRVAAEPPTDGPLFCVDDKPHRRAPADRPRPARRPGPAGRRGSKYVAAGTVDLLPAPGRRRPVFGLGAPPTPLARVCELLDLLDRHSPRPARPIT